MSSAGDDFFSTIPLVSDFADILQKENYRELPHDWCVFATDVVNSTAAIESGDYRAVNVLGAASITSALNAAQGVELPYSFGGDGALICSPPKHCESIKLALSELRSLAERAYGLELRAGCTPLSELKQRGTFVFVSRFGVSKFFSQAVFTGGGVELAERLIKDSKPGDAFHIAKSHESEPNLEGLECRWQDIPSPREETISLLVKALGTSEEDRASTYLRVLSEIDIQFGAGRQCHPVPHEHLKLALSASKLKYESSIRKQQPAFKLIPGMAGLKAVSLLGAVLMKCKVKIGSMNWASYKEDVAASTDVRKFDDMYRQVLSGSRVARENLTAFLDAERCSGKLVYGIHASNRALMTCVIFDRKSRHTHFVDAADGGYALAGKQLKSQLLSV